MPEDAARGNETARIKRPRTEADCDVPDGIFQPIVKASRPEAQRLDWSPFDSSLAADETFRVERGVCLRYDIADSERPVKFVEGWNSKAGVSGCAQRDLFSNLADRAEAPVQAVATAIGKSGGERWRSRGPVELVARCIGTLPLVDAKAADDRRRG